MPAFLPDVPAVREDLADYLGEVQAFDAALGVLLKKLEAIGELDHTLIVVSGDHGPPGFPRGKCNLYDFGTHVPLVVRWQGAKGGRVVDDLVSLTDLAPTFLDVAGVPIPGTMTGKSLRNVLRSEKSGLVEPGRTRSSPAASGTSIPPARVGCPILRGRSGRQIICSSSTSIRSGGPWATRSGSMPRIPRLARR